MGVRRVIVRNVFWNWAGMAVDMLIGVAVLPFLFNNLGKQLYGLWLFIASLTGYFGLLDFGIRGAVGRNVAFYRGRNDAQGVNSIINTAALVLSSAAGCALLGTIALLFFFSHAYPVPPELSDNPALMTRVQVALLVVGVNLALTLVFNLFDAILWGYERFDLINAVDIPASAIRTGLVMYFVLREHGLVALAGIAVIITLFKGLAKAFLCFWIVPELRVGRNFVSLQAAKRLYGYGIWHFVLSVSRMINEQLSPTIIGYTLGLALVAIYSVPARLISYASSFLVASSGVLTPLAASLHAREEHAHQRTMFMEGSKYCLALYLLFLCLFVFLGEPLILLWVGPDLSASFPLLVILAVGEALPMSQWTSCSMILGMGRHRTLALLGLLENVLVISLAAILIPRLGLVGVSVAFALPAALCRGVLQTLYACRLVEVPVGQYLAYSVLPPLTVALVSGLGLGLCVSSDAPTTWPELIAYTACFTIVYLILVAVFLLGIQKIGVALTRSRLKRQPLPALVESDVEPLNPIAE
jgi:O-antigen/teichoic acid export membrane protein